MSSFKIRRRLFVLLSPVLLWPLSACSHDAASEGVQAVPVVPAVRVVRIDLGNSITLTAEFEPFYEVDVMAKEAGYIRRMLVDIGDHVEKGQLLAALEIPELQADLVKAKSDVQTASAERAVARGDLQRAQAAAQIAQLSFERIQDVSKKEPGLVPLQEVDVAHSHNLEADAEVSAALERVQAAESRYQSAVAGLAHETALVEYTQDRRSISRRSYPTLCERGIDDSSRHFFADAGDAGGQGFAERSAAANAPGARRECQLDPKWPPRNRVCTGFEPHLRRHGNAVCGSSADVDPDDDRGGRCQELATEVDPRDVRPGDPGNSGGQKRKCCSPRRHRWHGR